MRTENNKPPLYRELTRERRLGPLKAMGKDLAMILHLASELVLIRSGKRGKGKVDITRWNNPLPKSHWTAETLPITVNRNAVI